MQFKENGKKIQCMRLIYDSITDKKYYKTVALFNRGADKVPSHGLKELTDGEWLQLRVWFDARQKTKTERIHQNRVANAASSLAQLGASIEVVGAPMTEVEAAAIWNALAGVAQALHSAGYPMPKRECFSLGDVKEKD